MQMMYNTFSLNRTLSINAFSCKGVRNRQKDYLIYGRPESLLKFKFMF